MKRVVLAFVWISVTAIVVGFFLPWATVDLREPSVVTRLRENVPMRDTLSGLTKDLGRVAVKIRRGAETVAGDLPTLSDIPKQVSGVQIPQMVNQDKAKVALALMELLTKKQEQLGIKSYAVYLLPGLAMLCGVLLTVFSARVPVVMGTAALCAGVAGIGFWKLLTMNAQALFVAMTIGQGLWLSLWGYVGLALAALLLFPVARLRS